jgi:surface antigen
MIQRNKGSFPPTRSFGWLLAISFLFSFAACQGAEPSVEEKYADQPQEDPNDLSVRPGELPSAAATVSLRRGQFVRYRFVKQAGVRYVIGLTNLTGDMDMFGHWLPQVSYRSYHMYSARSGTREEEIAYNATENGDYYIAIYARQNAQGRLVLYKQGTPTTPTTQENPQPNLNHSAYQGSGGNPFAKNQCTWYAWGRAKEIFGKSISFSKDSCRHGGNWYDFVTNAQKGSSPRANSIAVWKNGTVGCANGPYGHVAYVERVQGDQITFTEANWGPNQYNGYKTLSRSSFEKRSGTYSIVGYLYLQ